MLLKFTALYYINTALYYVFYLPYVVNSTDSIYYACRSRSDLFCFFSFSHKKQKDSLDFDINFWTLAELEVLGVARATLHQPFSNQNNKGKLILMLYFFIFSFLSFFLFFVFNYL